MFGKLVILLVNNRNSALCGT